MRVAMMLYSGFQLLEASCPMDVFHEANRVCGTSFYEQHVVGPVPGPVVCSNGTAVGTTACLRDLQTPFDILVIPGSPLAAPGREQRELVAWLRDVGCGARKIASVSNGAFLLAHAGLANHHRVTTRSCDAQRLAGDYPLVEVVSESSCVKDGYLYSSDGLSAGIQLALCMVAEDLGESVVDDIARTLLVSSV